MYTYTIYFIDGTKSQYKSEKYEIGDTTGVAMYTIDGKRVFIPWCNVKEFHMESGDE